jgi:hypothetical protein
MDMLFAQLDPPKSNFWAIPTTDSGFFGQPVFWWIVGAFLGTSLFLLVLSRIPSNFRKPITVGVTFLAGMYFVLEWLVPRGKSPTGETTQIIFGLFDLRDAGPVVSSVSQILQGMLLALGVMSILRVHVGRLVKMQKDWFYSAILLVSLFAMVTLGAVNFRGERAVERDQARVDMALKLQTPDAPGMTEEYAALARVGIDNRITTELETKWSPIERRFELGEITKEQRASEYAAARDEIEKGRTEQLALVDRALADKTLTPEVADLVKDGIGTSKERGSLVQWFNLLFGNGLLAMDAAMFSLIGFFILSAAYRAFRIRSVEASILMATALVVLLMFVPIALQLTNGLNPDSFQGNFRIDSIGMWLLSTINVPAIRAIDFGLGLGLLAMALRIMLGLERGVAAD